MAVRTGIYTKFTGDNTSTLYTLLGGTRLYYNEASQGPVHPYCVFRIFGETLDWTFDLEFENVLVQFDYYSLTADDGDSGVAAIKLRYDYAALANISNFTPIVMQRVDVMNADKQQPSDVWLSIVRYELMMQKS